MTKTEVRLNEYAKIVLELPEKMNINELHGMFNSLTKASKYFQDGSQTNNYTRKVTHQLDEETVNKMIEYDKQGKKPKEIGNLLGITNLSVSKRLSYIKRKEKELSVRNNVTSEQEENNNEP